MIYVARARCVVCDIDDDVIRSCHSRDVYCTVLCVGCVADVCDVLFYADMLWRVLYCIPGCRCAAIALLICCSWC